MAYYPEPDSDIRDKVNVVLGSSNYTTKRECNDAAGVDTSNLAAKSDGIASKAEVDKLDINKLVNFSNGLNNLKAKVNDLDVDKLKFIPIDLKKLIVVVSKEVVKKKKFNTVNTKVNH